jgi:sugar O-acyltransferase (sialic acid O-acetyltransferase NeuD family)
MSAMDEPRYVIFGGGEHASVVMECLLAGNFIVEAVVDSNGSENIFGVPVYKDYHRGTDSSAKVIVAIGDNALRKKIVGSNQLDYGKAVHPSVVLSPSSSVGEGCMILQGAIVQTRSRVGSHVILNTGCQVDHNCVVEDFAHIGPGAILCGSVKIGEGAFVGAGATVIPGTRIGSWSTVGAGSVVIRDVPDSVIVAGNPARIIKRIQV